MIRFSKTRECVYIDMKVEIEIHLRPGKDRGRKNETQKKLEGLNVSWGGLIRPSAVPDKGRAKEHRLWSVFWSSGFPAAGTKNH